jgi:MATE family multidrug resistance protein
MFAVAMGLARDRISLPQLRRLSPQVLDRDALRGFFALGADITIRTLLLISTFAVFTNLAALMGTAVLAATAVLRQVVMLAAWFIDGYAFAVESLAGIFHGAGETQRLRRLLRLAHAWALATGAFFAVAFWLAPRPLLGILTNHGSVLDNAVQQVGWLVPVLLFSAPAYVLDGYFLGLTAGSTLRRAMLLSVAVGFLPLAAIAHRNASIDLLWASLAAFMLARAATLGRQVGRTLRPRTTG